ncbi:MAG: HD domain-containing protein [Gemmatimonadetes bacterium]|nr:HD domain-containing protein [Gemmatimonadota bacterium]
MSQRIEDAITAATRYHAGQTRKGSGAPYVLHPLAVAALVADAGGDEDTIIAALLHDAVEDAGGADARAEIADRFGEAVARIVDGCSDTDEEPKPPWRPRKEAFVLRVRRAAPEVRQVVAADKIHNARSLRRDLHEEGDAVWSRFHGGREGSLWYFAAVADALADGWSHPLLDELRRVVARLQREVEAPR